MYVGIGNCGCIITIPKQKTTEYCDTKLYIILVFILQIKMVLRNLVK